LNIEHLILPAFIQGRGIRMGGGRIDYPAMNFTGVYPRPLDLGVLGKVEH
jgi:hypothetical protein